MKGLSIDGHLALGHYATSRSILPVDEAPITRVLRVKGLYTSVEVGTTSSRPAYCSCPHLPKPTYTGAPRTENVLLQSGLCILRRSPSSRTDVVPFGVGFDGNLGKTAQTGELFGSGLVHGRDGVPSVEERVYRAPVDRDFLQPCTEVETVRDEGRGEGLAGVAQGEAREIRPTGGCSRRSTGAAGCRRGRRESGVGRWRVRCGALVSITEKRP